MANTAGWWWSHHQELSGWGCLHRSHSNRDNVVLEPVCIGPIQTEITRSLNLLDRELLYQALGTLGQSWGTRGLPSPVFFQDLEDR